MTSHAAYSGNALEKFKQIYNIRCTFVFQFWIEETKFTLETRPKGESYGTNVMFSDGEHIGHVAAAKDVSPTFLMTWL